MSLIINPEDAASAISKDEISKIPECVFWLPCDETGSAITVLNDVVNNETVTIESSTNLDGAVLIPNTPNAPYSGTLPPLSADFALMVVAKTSTVVAGINYGGGAQKINMGSAATEVVGAGGTDTLDAIPAGSLTKLLIVKDTSGDAYLYQSAIGAALANTLNPVTLSGVITPTVDELVIQAFSGTTNMYGYAVLDLSANGVPSDIVSWCDWTMEQWNADNKVLPRRFTEL